MERLFAFSIPEMPVINVLDFYKKIDGFLYFCEREKVELHELRMHPDTIMKIRDIIEETLMNYKIGINQKVMCKRPVDVVLQGFMQAKVAVDCMAHLPEADESIDRNKILFNRVEGLLED
jgi:hypothetical protein